MYKILNFKSFESCKNIKSLKHLKVLKTLEFLTGLNGLWILIDWTVISIDSFQKYLNVFTRIKSINNLRSYETLKELSNCLDILKLLKI